MGRKDKIYMVRYVEHVIFEDEDKAKEFALTKKNATIKKLRAKEFFWKCPQCNKINSVNSNECVNCEYLVATI